MKSLGVKRIAALAAGAVVLGASLAVAADVTYSGVPIIDETGEPKVKIVVGAKAAASDGVAAANIAAMIVNLAYKSQAVTASIEGSPTCTVEGAGEEAGACAISNEKATLEVTIPGALSGGAGFQTYINDFVDKKTKNRLKNTSEDKYETSTDPSPFVKPDGTPIGTGHAAKKITGGDLPSIATFTTRDAFAGATYTEEQTIWVQGKTRYDTSLKKVIAASPYAAYKIEFTHDDFGIPVATCRNQADGNLNNCADAHKTDGHRVVIRYLNSDWIISEMRPPNLNVTGPATNETCDGDSYIKLAKERFYGMVHVGESFTIGAYTVKLTDVTGSVSGDFVINASIEIYDANNMLVKEARISSQESRYEWTMPDGSKVRIQIYTPIPGYRTEMNWAEIGVYLEEIELKNGEKVNDKNPNWKVQLCWRNKENEKSSKWVDALRKIILRSEATMPSSLTPGDSLGIIADPTQFQFSFEGLTCTDVNYDTLTFTIRNLDNPIKVYLSTDCTGTPTNSSQYVLYVQSGLKRAFSLTGGEVSDYYVDLDTNKTIYQPLGSNCFIADTPNKEVIYNVESGSKKQTIKFTGTNGSSTRDIKIKEYAGATPESDNMDYFYLSVGSDYKFNMTDKATYYGTIAGQLNYTQTVDEGYISERGSVFVSVDSTAASFKMAKKICEAQYYVKTTGVEPDEPRTIILAEGETSQGLPGGIVIKVKDISQTARTTASGGTIRAVPSVDSAKKVRLLDTAVDKMVVLDTDPAAESAANLILIGGPVANKITKITLVGDHAVEFTPGKKITKVVGNKIIIAGYSAEDTTVEAKTFIKQLIALRKKD